MLKKLHRLPDWPQRSSPSIRAVGMQAARGAAPGLVAGDLSVQIEIWGDRRQSHGGPISTPWYLAAMWGYIWYPDIDGGGMHGSLSFAGPEPPRPFASNDRAAWALLALVSGFITFLRCPFSVSNGAAVFR